MGADMRTATSWDLRVEWPIYDDGMYDAEAITAAWFDVPGIAEHHQVTIAGPPRMRVHKCMPEQVERLGAYRVVVCEIAVLRRAPIEFSSAAACGKPTEKRAAA